MSAPSPRPPLLPPSPEFGELMLAPIQLLHRELRHWLPMVVVLSMLSVVPETLLATVVPDPLAMVSGGAVADL